MARIISGKEISAEVYSELEKELEELKGKGVTPGLAVVLVGENPASKVYVGQKEKKCAALGIDSKTHRLAENTSEEELLELIDRLNGDPGVHGILVQLPLPDHIDSDRVIEAISPEKDVDGFHPANMGNLLIRGSELPPCTPHGIMVMLEKTGVELKGKHAVVLGRSNIVGKPVAIMLLAKHATVTICHSRTQDLPSVTRQADVLVAAVGRPKFVTAEMVKEGAVVIDVGINRVDDKLVGDVDFEAVQDKVAAITPVPGGVGPMTIAMLMKNTVAAARAQAAT